ncbi:hypothetical protein C5F59_014335 [Streptomyces sp. QL37]|uniref:hypothetical protein n=1 Tax=Streptomyces sp. QL37 TaxID=2093747 RepID=UPI000CF2587B|nr:hypothetical protein [Streptomyces sp. QL37]PPQ59446.1 hypothetical protein C5F59_24355 [Streptomyces sp. QL37]
MAAESENGLPARLSALDAAVNGGTAPPGDASWEDGHARWELYRRAAEQPAAHALLLDAVRAETDGPLASAVVVLMLEKTPVAAHGSWTAALDPEVRDFAERRSGELAVLESLDRNAPAYDADGVGAWSDWLQLRAARSRAENHRPVLDLLAEHGRTNRIRRTAAESVADLRKA